MLRFHKGGTEIDDQLNDYYTVKSLGNRWELAGMEFIVIIFWTIYS